MKNTASILMEGFNVPRALLQIDLGLLQEPKPSGKSLALTPILNQSNEAPLALLWVGVELVEWLKWSLKNF